MDHPRAAHPEQADVWTWLIIAAYTQLRLARGLVDDLRMPWEKPTDPARLTPARVRRGFRLLRSAIGTPARPQPNHPKAVHQAPDDPKAPENPHEPATQPSKKQPDNPPRFNRKLRPVQRARRESNSQPSDP